MVSVFVRVVQQNEQAVFWVFPRLAYGGSARSSNQTTDRNRDVDSGWASSRPPALTCPRVI